MSFFECAHFLTSFDIESLFTNIPLEKLSTFVLTNFSKTKLDNLTKESFRSLLELASLDSFFIFDGKYFRQNDGVDMGSTLGSNLVNMFLCHFQEQWMSGFPIDYKPISYRRYFDDTFLFFSSDFHVTKFLYYINSKHRNMKFTVEHEENNSL